MVDVKQLLDKLMMVAKDDRARLPYSDEEGFTPKLIFIGADDSIAVAAVGWNNERDKYAMLERAAEVARLTFAQAIVLVSDTRWITSDVFCAHFKIDPATVADVKAYQKVYLDILRQHDGQLKNLPRHLWNEAISVVLKGPMCGSHTRMAPYQKGPGDKVQYLPSDDREKKTEIHLIPEWWH
jgi:hypothetical protein